MNIFRQFFKKNKKQSNKSSEYLGKSTVTSDLNISYGNTVLLNSDIKSDFNDELNEKTEILNSNTLFDDADDFNINSATISLETEAKSILNQNNSNDADTILLNSNVDMFHSGDTVILNNNEVATKNNDFYNIKIFLLNPSTGDKHLITQSEYKIGSDESIVDLAILKPGISRHHASIFISDKQECYIVDNGSTNGTELEGVELQPFKRYLLESGALIMLANEIYQFYVEK